MTLRGVAWLIFVGFLLTLITDSVAQQNFAALEALRKLRLLNQPSDVPVYYSACCKQRAMQVQSTDCVQFYKEKLGIDQELIAAVLDENDWNRVVEERPNHTGPFYGMTHWAAGLTSRSLQPTTAE